MQENFVVLKFRDLCFEIIGFYLAWIWYQFSIEFTAAGMLHSKHNAVLI